MAHIIENLELNQKNTYPYAVSLLSETFWNERWEDLFDTLNEDIAEGEHPLLILYYEQSEDNDRILSDIDHEVEEYEASLENYHDEEDDFPTTMDKFEHFTGNSAWALPAPLKIAVSDNANSYAYPKWSTLQGIPGVVVLDTFDGDMAWV